MSDCARTGERLTAYLDGVLDVAGRGEVDRHLDACGPCRDRAAGERAGRMLLRRRAGALMAEPLPPGLRSRCEAIVAEESAPAAPGVWWRPRVVPVLLTVVLLVFTASAVISLVTRRSDAVMAAQLTADHSRCFRLFAPPAGTTVEAAAIERMFRDRYGLDVHVPPSAPEEGIELVGARRCLYGDGFVPHVMYRVQGQEVSLYLLNQSSRREAEVLRAGYRSRVLSGDGRTYVLVAPEAADGMARVARYVMQGAH
jgi:anti-sigma factor RsiW